MFIRSTLTAALLTSLGAAPAIAQTATDPFPQPIAATEGVVRVGLAEFASLPDMAGEAARPMLLVDEPGTRRLFVNDMRGPLYAVGYDGKTVTRYLDINQPEWGVPVQSMGRERGFQSFALHPTFGRPGTRGFGKLYTWLDTSNMAPAPDHSPLPGSTTPPTHDTVLLEWTAKTPTAATYDGGPPRELLRLRQPFANHNAGQLGFNSTAAEGSADFGLLYVGVADGGSGGDPLRMAQNLGSPFGKILRIDSLARTAQTASTSRAHHRPRRSAHLSWPRPARGLRDARPQAARARHPPLRRDARGVDHPHAGVVRRRRRTARRAHRRLGAAARQGCRATRTRSRRSASGCSAGSRCTASPSTSHPSLRISRASCRAASPTRAMASPAWPTSACARAWRKWTRRCGGSLRGCLGKQQPSNWLTPSAAP